MKKGISLFANVGIAETYFESAGCTIAVANELESVRADFYKHLHPNTNMIVGDFRNPEIKNALLEAYRRESCEFVVATPPCQGMSLLGKRLKDDKRNELIVDTIEFIKIVNPDFCIIENVPQILKTKINVDGEDILIPDYINKELGKNYVGRYSVLNAEDYGTPQSRKRAIIVLINRDKKDLNLELPPFQDKITVRDAIGNLPSLESGQDSGILHHKIGKINEKYVRWLSHTPTGKSARENPVHYPAKDNGDRIKGFATTYKRIDWDKPAPTITMSNGQLGGQSNGHPGRLLSSGLWSDARPMTILELLRLTGLPDDWNLPNWASEPLVRKVIGECFPPKFALAVLEAILGKDN